MKAILFDLDGTLTNNGEGIINCASLALEHYGIPVPSREEMRVFVGPPLHDTFVKFGVPEEEADKAVEVYRSRYIPIGMFENKVYPGIEEILCKLHAQGHQLYVATSKPEWMAQKILTHFNLAKYFTLICGATMDKSRSSKASVIAYVLENCPCLENLIMVGDTAFDVLGAKAHGIPTVGVAWGYGENEDMEKAGAAAIAYSMDELYNYIVR